MTLVEFLLARITEDEAAARAAIGTAVFQQQTGQWRFEWVPARFGSVPVVFAVADHGAKTHVANMEAAWGKDARGLHIARWDPARVLAECEWRRKLIERCQCHIKLSDDIAAHPERATDDAHRERIHGVATGCAIALDYLAAPYAGHPDYDEEWRP